MTTAVPVWRVDPVEADRMKILALLLADPNPLHYDAEAAKRLGISDQVVNQGPSNMAMLMNMLLSAVPGARIERFRARLLGNVLAGDAVEATGEIVARELDGDTVRLHCRGALSVAGRGDVVVAEAVLLTPSGGSAA